MLKRIIHRFYSDFMMPSRLKEYECIITTAKEVGYQFLTISEYYQLLKNNGKNNDQLIFISRHDIDSDVKTTRRFFEIEHRNNVKSSFYFRLPTADFNLMKEIHRYGSEASYHYEELATYAKRKHIKDSSFIMEHLTEIKKLFSENFRTFEKSCGYKLTSLASHGDFANRILNVPNHAFLDEELRNKLGIEVECYDSLLLENYDIIISDGPYPHFYNRMNPIEAIKNKQKVIYFLSHPRNWVASWNANTKENFQRIYEGIKY